MRRLVLLFLALAFGIPAAALAHCQIPCGIYDDEMRFQMMAEDITTIEKSMASILDLAGKTDALSVNQMERWVANKDHHADHLAEILCAYFLQQRIKAPEGDDPRAWEAYSRKLQVVHRMLVLAMQCKQTVDKGKVADLRAALTEFRQLYGAK
jgi:nickel superoxide dismutase